ncbi:maleate cis-trans isomerase family protein [Phaeobacter gallaeciensis]|uniref:Asp/Glu/hydantoin racemase-like protein n=1 Tax=Phaeobacter gallaeciensis TaxID=60890 RepID=A0AAC9Z850_9RHOB|nr:aspartate/glutamate racemase family protein [Phaeobacter gallaeciensis]AHD09055.1 Maleate cis-trans isomerase [Phaeobacter gallaeciensis DSM 26640]ATE92321.1 Asp/Glu/hydantoin racemase-like protein [Phaeobacter gallaeciensis]ATE97860.1 Asp/Glu/hydantoin racemase-like protein [Phaeobacter gallaeciensis]ATF00983.1 Asp/Glu/hydantoin racemase-like protein [Phaeobacter gallaeciensis]ATF05363.1 Asp/Glu/hydantoin racemase-like protein [Phaeobacter gallaeciensis]
MFRSGQTIQSKPRTPLMGKGTAHRASLGFILMSTDLACEADLFAMAPDGVGVHITRLRTDDYTTNETLARHIDHMADAAGRLQPDMKPAVIAYCCTSGSIVCREENVFREIRKGAPYTQPMSIVTGVMDALREVGAKQIVVGTPYLDDVNTAEAEYLLAARFDILDIQGLQLETGVEFGQVEPAYWKDFALEIDQPDADAIFLSCSGTRTLEVVEEIEQAAGKPVITSNQALMWSCLRRAGITDHLNGFGQLFNHPGRALTPTL